jgi:hypothetical protein
MVEHAASSTHVHARCAPSLSLVLGHACCALSRFGHARCDPSFLHADTAGVSLALGHTRCALSHIGVRVVFPLSLAAGRVHAHALSSKRNSRRRRGAKQQQQEEALVQKKI